MRELKLKKYLVPFIIINTIFINCKFQFSLFNQLNKKNKGKNLTISPLSIFQALSLVSNGANGPTQMELLFLLDDKGMAEINAINLKILNELKEITSLEMGNAIMTRLSPLNKFSKIAEDNYLAEIQPLKNVKQVNKWCEKKTNGKITEIIDKLDDNVYMIILNALYFKGQWEYPFSKSLTSKKLFFNYNSVKDSKIVDTMINTKYYSYYEDPNIQAVDLKYQKDGMSALIILPKKKLDINEFIDIFNRDHEYMYSIILNFNIRKVNIQIPKFEITYKESLKEVIKEMGVNIAFRSNADFSNIRTQNDIMIDDIIHKTYLKINEEGTEAAAVTAVTVKNEILSYQEITYDMIINRPFLFIIRNKNFPKYYDIIFISKIEEIN